VFLTSALDEDEWSASRPGHSTPENRPRYPVDSRLGGPHSWSECGGEVKESLSLPRIEPQVSVLPVTCTFVFQIVIFETVDVFS
jgi:hypothetical protein